jgi:LysM repeat protein
MAKKHIMIGILLAALLLGIMPAFSIAAPTSEEVARPAQQEGELLRNGNFEEDWEAASSHEVTVFPEGGGSYNKLIGNIFTPPGWITWFRHLPGTWDQPEVTDAHKSIDARRVNSGAKGIRLFTFWRDHDGGFYQVVSGLTPGATVQFSAYAAGWSCGVENPTYTSCGDDPYSITFAVGIEPNGEINPYSPNMAWSDWRISHDNMSLIGPTTATVGESGSVVVFVRSVTKWAYKHQDAYWDDASLTYTSPPAEPTDAAPPPPAAPAGPPPTPYPTPTPRPDGSIVHIVQVGETLFGISLQYNVPLDQIRQLNSSSLGGGDIIRPGQELVIALPSKTPVPTTPPEPTPAEVAEGGSGGGGEQPSQGGGTVGASICVLSYHDRDGNLQRGDATVEELLPNATFKLVNADGAIINQYISDGINEPFCFAGLAAGSYRVIQDPPIGYKSNSPSEQPIAINEGTSYELAFGNVRGEASGAVDEGSADTIDSGSSGGSEPGWLRSAFSTIFKVGGVLVLLACAGGVVLFVINQRRMAM